MKRCCRNIATTVLVTLVLGCGSDGPTLYPVSGSVTYQNDPVEKGQISFVPDTTERGGGPAQYTNIVNGKYQGKISAGNKRVEIRATRNTGKFIKDEMDGEDLPLEESFIPDKYNESSQLRVEIMAEPNDGVDFDLK